MMPDMQLDSPGMECVKAMRELARGVIELAALAKEGAAREGKLFAQLEAELHGLPALHDG